ncbi:MAG: hypothetical protein A2521_11815 [Deltaproteobacteria bacterium RIFOXYD12_FULL_57_12]|nr:MAG: hypothetical protein A2521_11815 [Deltaproteobacteria bacterium RIFOXYD12_FULL_57_12]
MSPPLRYLPAYCGLFAAQVLALTCNAFLDIRYGIFGTEVQLWAFAFAITLRVGWQQNGEISKRGNRWMRTTLVFGMLLSLLLFIPMWRFPRAAIYILAMLQVSYNCITTSRRHLHLSLLMSVAMVLFAATHFRADWAMFFYLIPYVTAVVFTLVAEQINRTVSELRRQSLGDQVVGAQGIAIAAATTVILALGLLLYTITPQVSWPALAWRWGLPGNVNTLGDAQTGDDGMPAGGGGGTGDNGWGDGGGGGSMRPGWPSADELRATAGQTGMPEWQRQAINGLADLADGLQALMKPVIDSLRQLAEALIAMLNELHESLIRLLYILMALAWLYALWQRLRQTRLPIWLRTRFDYFRLVLLTMHNDELQGARTCYEAMARLFELHDIKRGRFVNTLEYQAEINSHYLHLRRETEEITRLYEDARYGGLVGSSQVERMRELYRQVFQLIGKRTRESY